LISFSLPTIAEIVFSVSVVWSVSDALPATHPMKESLASSLSKLSRKILVRLEERYWILELWDALARMHSYGFCDWCISRSIHCNHKQEVSLTFIAQRLALISALSFCLCESWYMLSCLRSLPAQSINVKIPFLSWNWYKSWETLPSLRKRGMVAYLYLKLAHGMWSAAYTIFVCSLSCSSRFSRPNCIGQIFWCRDIQCSRVTEFDGTIDVVSNFHSW
jgi:hypothetical protein